MKVKSRKEAWDKADIIFPTDYAKDEARSAHTAARDALYGAYKEIAKILKAQHPESPLYARDTRDNLQDVE